MNKRIHKKIQKTLDKRIQDEIKPNYYWSSVFCLDWSKTRQRKFLKYRNRYIKYRKKNGLW